MMLSGKLKRHFSSLAIAAFASITASHSAAAAVVVTDLSAYGAVNGMGMAINNLGQVTGGAKANADDAIHPFIYANGQLRILDSYYIGSGMGINDAGQVVGGIFSNARGGLQAFLYDGTTMQPIGPPDETSGMATGINAQGQAAGYLVDFKSNNATGFIYTPGVGMTTLNGAQGNLAARDINSSGTVVGVMDAPGGGFHGFVLSNGVMTDIGTFRGWSSEARAVNELGQATGVASTELSAHAFLYENGVAKDIGALGVSNEGFDINLGGDIVGSYYDAAFNARAFIYTKAWGMVDLNYFLSPDSGWILKQALGINDGRTIVGIGTFQGEEKVFMMSGELAVPEPSMALLLLAGGVVIAAQTRRRRT